MALYVAICLIAALTALAKLTAIPGHIMGLVWGTTVGLAVAHVFAFRIAGRLVHDGDLPMGPIALSRWSSWLLPPQSRSSVFRFYWPQPSTRSLGLGIPAPPSSVWSATYSLAARNAVGSAPCCSASECWPPLSPSLRSNTRCRVTSVSRDTLARCVRWRLRTDDFHDCDADVVWPPPGYAALHNSKAAATPRSSSSTAAISASSMTSLSPSVQTR